MISQRELLLAMSYKHSGDWQKIYEDCVLKNMPTLEEINLAKKRVRSGYITILDPDYPEYLKKYYRPPFVLYYHGDISLINSPKDNLSVIGSRDCLQEDIDLTKKTIKELDKKTVIVSGLAEGIDGAAHEAALENDLKTIAVLGSGIEKCYPPININIYKKIKENGLVISEYPGYFSGNQLSFPARNRIIAMLSRATLITCGLRHSGTFITAEWALMFGKVVGCIPSRNFGDSVCNLLIKEGAYLIEDASDVKELMSGKIY